ncbi:MAG: class I SAM-dependent methyltransferase [Alphaproteobacteria bacterium]|nr:class I SAM-dependent methyltransferase [Alphaproteobacteria bacterium]
MPGPLKDKLIRRIREAGPLTVADYMRAALTDPDHGYYTTRDPIGAAGDFVTAPEISQVFGEMIGLWIADCWDAMGRPRHLKIVEAGPGRGTLMADVLRTLKVAPAMLPDPWLIETSPALRALQRQRIDGGTWAAGLDEVPPGPAVILANEFLDAMPIRQFLRAEEGWRERLVDVDADGSGFAWRLGPALDGGPGLPATADDAVPGSIVEAAPEAVAFVEQLSRRLVRDGGAALLVDYGATSGGPGDSLQAVSRHAYADPLDSPGEADLTAHVDFAALARAARDAGAAVYGPVPQAAFLEALGAFERAAVLKRSATPAQARDIDLGIHRLTAPDQMGSLFKAMAVADPAMPPPAGFGA